MRSESSMPSIRDVTPSSSLAAIRPALPTIPSIVSIFPKPSGSLESTWPRSRRKIMANRKLKTWAEIKSQNPLSGEAQAANAAWVEQQIVELNLQALRQQLGVTQAELSEASGFAQGEISRIEQREDHMVSTLRRLVRSL